MDFIDLKTQYIRIENSLDERLSDIMSSSRFIMGKEITELEDKLANYTGRKHCISCSSGTDALTMSLMALGVKDGDVVFVPSFTFFSTAESVSFLGGTPIYVDVYEDTFNIDLEKLEYAIKYVNEKTKLTPKVIMPVDLFGQPADYDTITKLARKYNLKVVEDGAQGFGGKIGDKIACSFGDISTTSFFPAKPLGCYGDGGAIFTDDDKVAEILKSIRVHGKGSDKYSNVRIGLNGRLDTMQAAVLLEKIKIFDEEVTLKNSIAEKYSCELNGIVDIPYVKEGYYSSWAQYTIKTNNEAHRDKLIDKLKTSGIPTAVYYKNPIHTLELYSNLEYIKDMDYSVSEDISKRVLSLPMHAYLTDMDIEKITDIIIK